MSPAAVAVVLIILCAAAEARVPTGHLATRRRDNVPAGVGACALAVAPLGYPCEEHTGPRGSGGGAGQPVLLQHGVLTDGMTWLLSSPEESLAYILADRGFDVWVANNRGTRWSSRHVSLDFILELLGLVMDDLVLNDMPSMVDYLQPHPAEAALPRPPMGTLVALAAFSEGRTVDKLKSAALLTPVAYLSHMTTPSAYCSPKHSSERYHILLITVLGVAEFNPAGGGEPFKELCRHPGTNCYDLHRLHREELLPQQLGRRRRPPVRAPADVHQDHGAPSPDVPRRRAVQVRLRVAERERGEVRAAGPRYNMSNIPAGFLPSSATAAGTSWPTGDVGRLPGDLRGHDRGKLTVQYLEQFAHADFVIGTCAKDYVYNDVVSFFNCFN
ncbi:hypothetical protein ZWY2020_005715 [Hordeum vulgare]|nr:hypothetical protein ZWY2020_005715 [Hordeum vulgare]